MATSTIDLQRGIFEDFITNGMFAMLVDMPELGDSNNLTSEEYEVRAHVDLRQAAPHELPAIKGYQRFIISNAEIQYERSYAAVEINASFEAEEDLGPFTHILVCCRGDTFNATASNGNNRGSTLGRVLLIDSTTTNYLPATGTYEYSTVFRLKMRDVLS